MTKMLVKKRDLTRFGRQIEIPDGEVLSGIDRWLDKIEFWSESLKVKGYFDILEFLI